MQGISKKQIEQFNEEGYLVLRNVISKEDFALVHEEYTNLLNDLVTKWKEDGYIDSSLPGSNFTDHLLQLCSQPSFPFQLISQLDITLPHMPFSVIREDSSVHIGPAVLSLLRNPFILNKLESILGSEICASPNQHCRTKLPESLTTPGFKANKGETIYAKTMWHQDMQTQMPQSNDTNLITVWIPMSNVNEENGCLLVAPGLHKNNDLLPWPMSEEIIENLNHCSVPIPVELGDIVLLNKKIPHTALPNKSNCIRWSFDFRYYAADQPTDRPWFPNILVRSRSNPDKEIKDATQWLEMWLKARQKLARAAQPLPGRREFATLVANALIKKWEDKNFAGTDSVLY
ncbi:hypothetical protein NUACC21_45740 [Scytonema sp. NUACC21]